MNTYKPDLIWSDGPDAINDKEWQVERTLAWLYSESPVKDSVVVNDRWANNTGRKHGDYYTRNIVIQVHLMISPGKNAGE